MYILITILQIITLLAIFLNFTLKKKKKISNSESKSNKEKEEIKNKALCRNEWVIKIN